MNHNLELNRVINIIVKKLLNNYMISHVLMNELHVLLPEGLNELIETLCTCYLSVFSYQLIHTHTHMIADTTNIRPVEIFTKKCDRLVQAP